MRASLKVLGLLLAVTALGCKPGDGGSDGGDGGESCEVGTAGCHARWRASARRTAAASSWCVRRAPVAS